MKNLFKVSALILLMLVISVGQIEAQKVNEGESTFLPALKKGYRPAIGIAVVGGPVLFTDSDDGFSTAYGVELSLQCPLYQCKKNYIRQQLSIVRNSDDFFSAIAIELAPHYRFQLGASFELGVGPHVGVSFINFKVLEESLNTSVFEYGAGGSLLYTIDRIFFGVDARYMFTSNVKVNDFDLGNVNNFRALAKIGYKF